jgi:hypothetical protein
MPVGSAFLMRKYRRGSGGQLWALGERVPLPTTPRCDLAADIADSRDLAKMVSELDRALESGMSYLEAPDAEDQAIS